MTANNGNAHGMTMSESEVEALFRETGVLLEGHFKLTSGRHGSKFLQCSQVMQHPQHAERLGAALGALFADDRVSSVIGPAMGGVVLAHVTARVLGARALFAEKEDGRMVLRRGFSVAPGERVLLVEDAISTGGSVMNVVDLMRAAGAEIVGIGCLVDRTAGKLDLGLPLKSLLRVDVPSYAPEECPLCAAGKPVTEPKKAK